MAAKRFKVVEVTHYDVIDTTFPEGDLNAIVLNTRDKDEADRTALANEEHHKMLEEDMENAEQ